MALCFNKFSYFCKYRTYQQLKLSFERMKKLTTVGLACFLAGAGFSQGVKPAIPRDASIEARVEKTLNSMTLDEKIGQMLELNIDVISGYVPVSQKLDRTKVRRALTSAGVNDAEI